MILYDKLPELRDLSCGSRIAYARQFRHMTQQKLGEAIGMSNDRIRNRVCRYEKGGRTPKKDRIRDMAKVLGVSEGMLKVYDFRDPLDFLYEMFWVEELFPVLDFNLKKKGIPDLDACKAFEKEYKKWRKVQLQFEKKQLTKREYMEWKLTFLPEGYRR